MKNILIITVSYLITLGVFAKDQVSCGSLALYKRTDATGLATKKIESKLSKKEPFGGPKPFTFTAQNKFENLTASIVDSKVIGEVNIKDANTGLLKMTTKYWVIFEIAASEGILDPKKEGLFGEHILTYETTCVETLLR